MASQIELALNNMAASLRAQSAKLSNLEAEVALAKQRDEQMSALKRIDLLRAQSARIIPFTYIIDINIAAASTARVAGAFQITSEGCFLCHRVRAAWRDTATNFYRGLSHGNPALASVSGGGGPAVPINVIDFTWEYVEGRSQRARQNQAIPGDLLYRCDDDGYHLEVPDEFGSAATIMVYVTPTVGTATAGILTFAFIGEQLLNTQEA